MDINTYLLYFTNQSLVYIVDVVQIIVLIALCVSFVIRKQNTVFVKVYSFLLLYLCGMTGIKLMFDLSGHADEWYKPYIGSSLMLVPVREGVMYSLYRHGASFVHVLMRILRNGSPFIILAVISLR